MKAILSFSVRIVPSAVFRASSSNMSEARSSETEHALPVLTLRTQANAWAMVVGVEDRLAIQITSTGKQLGLNKSRVN